MNVHSRNRMKSALKKDTDAGRLTWLLNELANEEQSVRTAAEEVSLTTSELVRREERTAHLRRALEELEAYERTAAEPPTIGAEGSD